MQRMRWAFGGSLLDSSGRLLEARNASSVAEGFGRVGRVGAGGGGRVGLKNLGRALCSSWYAETPNK